MSPRGDLIYTYIYDFFVTSRRIPIFSICQIRHILLLVVLFLPTEGTFCPSWNLNHEILWCPLETVLYPLLHKVACVSMWDLVCVTFVFSFPAPSALKPLTVAYTLRFWVHLAFLRIDSYLSIFFLKHLILTSWLSWKPIEKRMSKISFRYNK